MDFFTRRPKCLCPKCNNDIYKQAREDDYKYKPPREGNYIVCYHCRSVLLFNADLTMRLASVDELKEIETRAPGTLWEIQKRQRKYRQSAKYRRGR